MSRIAKAYEAQFRNLVKQLGARKPEKGVQWLQASALRLSQCRHLPLTTALTEVNERLAAKVFSRSKREARSPKTTSNPVLTSYPPSPRPACPPKLRFFCDAGLGGLARWLRAAGHEAYWEAHIEDGCLISQAQVQTATILTTDSLLMERQLLRDRIIPAFWLPPTLKIPEQLTIVFREFRLEVREPRCTACGGDLKREEKEALRNRIPPKTYRWLDEYFVCCRCDKLFWRGTHWQKISRQLEKTMRLRN